MSEPSSSAVVGPNDVAHVAWLARISLSETELPRLAAQMDDILRYVKQLQAVATTGVEPTSHVLALTNITRPDQRQPCLPPEAVAALAPATHNHFIKVPKVIDT